MLTAEYLLRISKNINNAVAAKAADIVLTINYTNGKSDKAFANDEGKFVKTPQILDGAFYVVGMAQNLRERHVSDDGLYDVYKGDYKEIYKPLELIESIDLAYVSEIKKTISKDVTPTDEPNSETAAE